MNPFKPWIGSFVLSLTTYIIRMFVREDKRGEIGCDVLFMFFSSLCNLLQYLTWKLFWFQIVNCPDSWCNARPISDPHVNNVKMFVSPCELLRDCSEKYTTKIQQICINNPGNIRGLSHFRHTIKCNEHIHSRYFHTEYIWYFYSSSPHNDSIFLNCICWV